MDDRLRSHTHWLRAPFPYFGGKRTIARRVWEALGQPDHYLEPFFGSGAVLLARPDYDPRQHIETVCDANGHIANVWRAIRAEPDAVARYCDWPVSHPDLIARRRVLREREATLRARLETDPDYYDPVLAGYWVWAAGAGIGRWYKDREAIPTLTGQRGIHQLSLRAQAPALRDGQLVYTPAIYDWLHVLAVRLRYVQIVCGDWTRICSGSWQTKVGIAGIFFDPPYAAADRDPHVYDHHDSTEVAHAVRAWCLERGSDPRYRIVLAGYEEHEAELVAAGWTVERWVARGGWGNLGVRANRTRERLYFSPHCLPRRLF